MKASTYISCLTLGLALTSGTVFAQPINLAPAGTATASSVLSDNPIPAASKAIDGNRDGNYYHHSVWHSSCSDAAWLEVDLGNTYYLDRVQIFPRSDWDNNASNFKIEVRDASYAVVFQQDYFTSGDRINVGTGWGTADMRGIQGRYVRVTKNFVDCFVLGEFEVYAQSTPILSNLAMGKPATATPADFGTAITNGNDGNLDGNYTHAGHPIYHSGSQGVGTFWQVDLESTNQLGYVLIFNRDDGVTTSTVKLSVLDGSQSTVWSTNVNISPNVLVLNSGQYDLAVPIPAGVTGRYVRMETTLNEFLAFGELQVFPALPPFSTAGYWNGLQNSAWDSSTTANWSTNLNTDPLEAATFSQAMALSGGTAYFADTYYANGTTYPVTRSNVTVAAGGVSTTTVNFQSAAVNYTVSGADSVGITGTTAVHKSGAATLTLAGGNTYSGATTISGGAIKLGAANAVSNSTVTVSAANGLTFGTGIGTFALGGLAGDGNLALSDTGGTGVTLQVGGNGGSSTYAGVMSGNGAVTKAGGGTLTLSGENTYTNGTTVNQGVLYANAGNSAYGALGYGNVTVNNGGTILIGGANSFVGEVTSGGRTITINSGGTITNSASTCHLNALVMNGGTLVAATANPSFGNWDIDYGVSTPGNGSSSSIAGGNAALTQVGGTVFNIGAGDTLTVSAALNHVSDYGIGDTGLKKSGTGTLIVSANNTYNGGTTVSAGTLELGIGGSLSGVVSIQSAGTLATDPAGINSYTLNGSLTLAGNIRLKINGDTSSADNLGSLSGVTYGGTLTVTNLGTAPLANGQSFTLFTLASGAYGGAFANLNLPTLPSGLSWDISQLTVNGLIRVVNTAPTPVFVPPAGGYVGAVSVSIQCGVSNATIHYTTDGTTPTNTSPSGLAPVTVVVAANTNLTIQAYATAPGYATSPVGSATYQTVASPVWINPSGGSWAGTVNWSNNVPANGSGVNADFSRLTLPSDAPVTLNGYWTVGSLTFGDAGGQYGWSIDPGSGGLLTLDNGTNAPIIAVTNQTATISALLAGTSGMTKTGPGTLTLTARSSFGGGTMVNDGKLVINAPNSGYSAIGTGTLTIGPSGRVDTYVNGFGGFYETPIVVNGGTLHQMQYDSHLNTVTMTGGTLSGEPGTTFNLRNGVVVNASSDTATISVPTLNVWSGTVFDVADGAAAPDLLVSSFVVGGGYLTKTGAGTMVLSGGCNYSGATTVNQGTLVVNSSLVNTAVTVNQGTLELGSGGSISGAVSIQSSGTLATDPAGINSYTLSGSLMTLAGNIRLNINGDTSSADNLGGLSGVTYGGTLTVTNLGTAPLANGQSFTLFTLASGTYGGAFANLNLPLLPSGLSWDVSQLTVNGSIRVINTAPLVPPVLASGVSLGGGQFQLTFSGPSGQTYKVLTSTNVTLPMASWTQVSSGTFGGSPVVFTDSGATNAQQFYRAVSP